MNYAHIKVDILMATYNGEKYLREQIDSIITQTHSNFNLIIVDDCSTDSTMQILLEYQSRDSRLVVHQNEENIGVIKNFEKLLGHSEADYFLFCDQDDVWDENKIELLLEIIKESNALLVFSDLEIVDEQLNYKGPSDLERLGIKDELISIKPTLLLMQNLVTGCTTIFSKKIKKIAYPFQSEITMHDEWLAVCSAFKGKILYFNRKLVKYRQHENNVVGVRDFTNTKSFKLSGFLEKRSDFLNIQKSRFRSYLFVFSDDQEVLNILNNITREYERFQRIKYFSLDIRNFLFKIKYPSLGVFRNIWWTLYYSLPICSYLLFRLFTFTKRVRGRLCK